MTYLCPTSEDDLAVVFCANPSVFECWPVLTPFISATIPIPVAVHPLVGSVLLSILPILWISSKLKTLVTSNFLAMSTSGAILDLGSTANRHLECYAFNGGFDLHASRQGLLSFFPENHGACFV